MKHGENFDVDSNRGGVAPTCDQSHDLAAAMCVFSEIWVMNVCSSFTMIYVP